MNQSLFEFRDLLSKKQPLIHCITNPISINQCANAILAVGARPIMAEHPAEVADITVSANALMLNLGNITDVRMASMEKALLTALEHNIPVVLDVVGIACSPFRRNFALSLLQIGSPSVIKGNYSEIYALLHDTYHSSGVDADTSLSADHMDVVCTRLAQIYNTVILASGKTDIISNGHHMVFISNGTPQLSQVTGTGCMLGALCASFLSIKSPLDAASAACATLGICGQLAETEKGNGSFLVALMDQLSTVSTKTLIKLARLEESLYEQI